MVLEQAWKEGVKPCLVLNKLDRLVTELSESPTEAYYHIRHVLEQLVSVCVCTCNKDNDIHVFMLVANHLVRIFKITFTVANSI